MRRIPRRLEGLVTSDIELMVVSTYKALIFPGDATRILACGDAWVYVDDPDVDTIAADHCYVASRGLILGYNRMEACGLRGAELHMRHQCKFLARPGCTVYMYDSARGRCMSGSTVVIDASCRYVPKLEGRVRVIDHRPVRRSAKPHFSGLAALTG